MKSPWRGTIRALAALAVLPAPLAVAAIVQRPIAIDGDMLDWAPVLASPQNYVSDLSIEQGDPDLPGSSDRDMRAFAFTWDATNLYFYFRRTFEANNSVTYLIYLDLNHDGVLTTADRIVRYDFNGGSPSTRELRAYVPAAGSDPITGDGVNEPGSAGIVLASSMGSASSSTGIDVECSIAWASLGVPAGAPLRFHASIASGMNLPGHVRDNTDATDSQFAGVAVSADRLAAGGSPSIVRLAHRVVNSGNGADVIDLTAASNLGWTVAVWSDPDGDGDPADGSLLAVDGNGDGDFSDPLDVPPAPSADGNGNLLPDGGTLAAGAARDFVLELSIPASVPNGSQDSLRVVGRSGLDASVFGRNMDTIVAGPTTLSPDRSKQVAPGRTADLGHRACNFGGGPDVLDLTWTSLRGWPVVLWSDPDQDGDPSDGVPLTDTNLDGNPDSGPLAAGSCLGVVARVSVPGGTTLGAREDLTITAASAGGLGSDTVADSVYAAARVDFALDRAHVALPGEVLFSPHTVTNGGDLAEAYDLLATTTLGSSVSFWTDPNCDGRVDDGLPASISPVVPPFGGSTCVVAQIRIPRTLSAGSVETATQTARSQPAPSEQDTVRDVVQVVLVRTYVNALLTLPSSTFFHCSTVYAGAAGLAPGSEYRFVWNDPNLGDGAERTSAGYTADDLGRVDDRYTIQLADLVGSWTVKLQRRQGASWLDVTPYGSFTFVVLDDSSAAGQIEELRTDRINYDVLDATVRVTGEVLNDSAVTFYRDTRFEYVIFLDSNGDGRPTLGEPYILPSGDPAPWAPGATTRVRNTITVYPLERLYDSWQMADVDFGTAAVWSVHMAWKTPCNTYVAESVMQFSVGCAWSPTADAGADRAVCPGGSAAIGTPAQARRSYSWSPATGLSDAAAAEPVAAPAASTAYTVTVTDLDSGCTAADTVVVTVLAPPVPDVTPNGPAVCAGGSLTLDAGAGFASYLWSTSETTRTIVVTPGATTTYSVTVTDGNGCSGTGAETVTVNPLPAPDVTPDLPVACAGEPTVLDAGTGYVSYAWSTGDATRTITVSPVVTTSYDVTVTDGNGCQATVSETVTVNPLPVVDVTPDGPQMCPGESVTLDAGAGFAAYLWSTGDATQSVSVSPPATAIYTVTVTDTNGCDNQASETVVVNPEPVPDIVPDSPRVCGGGPITLDAGPGFDSYAWSTGDTTRTITVTPAVTTSYTVTVTNGFGCGGSTSETVTVDSTPEIFPPNPETCAGSPIVLDAGAGWAGYLWSTGETTRRITVAPAATTGYSVTVQDVNGCTGNASIVVTVHPLPDPAIVPLDVEVCPGSPVVLDAGAGYDSYLWSSGERTRTITVSPQVTTTYTVTVSTAFGCAASTSATVRVRPVPIYPPERAGACAGGSAMLDAGPGFGSYRWSTGETTQTIVVPAVAATYSVELTDSFGCATDRLFEVFVTPLPIADAGPDRDVCAGVPTEIGSAGVSGLLYLWSPPDGLDDPTKARPVVVTGTSRSYTVTVTDPALGCTSSDSVTVTVTPAGPPDPMDNLLRETREGGDIRHSWTLVAGLQRYDLSVDGVKDFSAAVPLGTVGGGVSNYLETGAVSSAGLRFYRIQGSDCPLALTAVP